MKYLILLSAVLLQACSPNSSSPASAKISVQDLSGIESTLDGNYKYESIKCFDQNLTALKKTIVNKTYEHITISKEQLTAKIGYVGNDQYIEVSGKINQGETSFSITNLTITSSTSNEWHLIGNYVSGLLSYPKYSPVIEFTVGMSIPDIQDNDLIIDKNGDIYAYFPNNNLNIRADANDKCYLYLEKYEITETLTTILNR